MGSLHSALLRHLLQPEFALLLRLDALPRQRILSSTGHLRLDTINTMLSIARTSSAHAIAGALW